MSVCRLPILIPWPIPCLPLPSFPLESDVYSCCCLISTCKMAGVHWSHTKGWNCCYKHCAGLAAGPTGERCVRHFSTSNRHCRFNCMILSIWCTLSSSQICRCPWPIECLFESHHIYLAEQRNARPGSSFIPLNDQLSGYSCRRRPLDAIPCLRNQPTI